MICISSALRALFFVCACALALLPAGASDAGKGFLEASNDKDASDQAQSPADMLVELERMDLVKHFDHVNMTGIKAKKLETGLQALFKIASKDSQGRIDANEARYLLHRLFARHGWFVHGLELHLGVLNTSKVGEAFFSTDKFTFAQLLHFAATFETLVLAENIDRLKKAFAVYNLKKDRPYKLNDANLVIEAYMVYFITLHQPNMTFKERKFYCETGVADWPDTKEFMQDVMRKVIDANGQWDSLWDYTLEVVEQIAERYGRWQNMGCLKLKSKLMELETPGTGRVPLAAFWAPALSTKLWPFVESIPYLEQLGALEGSEALDQFVVIPNYLYSATNCLAGSKYYDVCCVNECEEVLGDVEDRIGMPAAQPKMVAEVVKNLPSSTVDAPRDLPNSLTQRLEDIAAQNSGVVPLHERLFAQFLHHAFPHECPYPRHSLTKTRQVEIWIQRTDNDARVDLRFIEEYTRAAHESQKELSEPSSPSELPWANEEELFMHSLRLESKKLTFEDASIFVPVIGVLLAGGALIFRLRQPLKQAMGMPEKTVARFYV
eukprot:TRINITY_DN54628_c0_g1_i1.p1 TRINITY_DN54628_c0_g1~~TRINITY_DN54628_c0_g1_i1.p1  ORF type:complete len:567 (+),score=106.91 TRINITY_DN54628_c0_g1_i1:54-1703(+)